MNTVCANFDPKGNGKTVPRHAIYTLCNNLYHSHAGGFGSWSSDDCRIVFDRDGQAQCRCSQPAHFGLLFVNHVAIWKVTRQCF